MNDTIDGAMTVNNYDNENHDYCQSDDGLSPCPPIEELKGKR